MSSDSNHKVWLTVDELIYLTDAAIEERKSRRPLPASFVAARLREAIQASKSRLMVAAEQKLAHLKDKMTPVILKPEKQSAQEESGVSMPTIQELVDAKLDVYKILEFDRSLTPEVMIHVGLLQNVAQCKALGIERLDQFLKVVGPPSQVCEWMGGRDSLAWKTFFIEPMKFDWKWWCNYHDLLKPKDLYALHFHLGGALEVNVEAWETLPFLAQPDVARKWLSQGTQEEWQQWAGLTEFQYKRAMGYMKQMSSNRTPSVERGEIMKDYKVIGTAEMMEPFPQRRPIPVALVTPPRGRSLGFAEVSSTGLQQTQEEKKTTTNYGVPQRKNTNHQQKQPQDRLHY